MAKLYEMPQDDFDPELTVSLAQSFKEGLILPAERKFSLLEREIAALRDNIDINAEKINQQLHEQFTRLNTEIIELKKLFRICTSLSLLSLAGIITILLVLFNWY